MADPENDIDINDIDIRDMDITQMYNKEIKEINEKMDKIITDLLKKTEDFEMIKSQIIGMQCDIATMNKSLQSMKMGRLNRQFIKK